MLHTSRICKQSKDNVDVMLWKEAWRLSVNLRTPLDTRELLSHPSAVSI